MAIVYNISRIGYNNIMHVCWRVCGFNKTFDANNDDRDAPLTTTVSHISTNPFTF